MWTFLKRPGLSSRNRKYLQIILQNAKDIGRTNLIKLDIPMEGPPITSKLYMVPLKYQEFVDHEICCHMLMSTLPMTQFWNAGSSAHQYSCGPAVAFTLVRLADEPVLQNWVIGCCHMLMSTLPMTQFWSTGSSAHQYSCCPTAAFTLVRLANETVLVSSRRSSTI